MDYNNIDIDAAIANTEKAIENIFNRYTNDDFESIVAVPFIYKNTIRFVPLVFKNKMTDLLRMYDELLQIKSKSITRIR